MITWTSSRARKGVGTLKHYRVIEGTTFLDIERENGQRIRLSASPEVARNILDRFGHQTDPNFISVESIIDAKVAYEETATGMLTKVTPFLN